MFSNRILSMVLSIHDFFFTGAEDDFFMLVVKYARDFSRCFSRTGGGGYGDFLFRGFGLASSMRESLTEGADACL